MRPPSRRFAIVDPSKGPETVTLNDVPAVPGVDQDDEGNWVRTPVAGTTYVAVVSRQSINRALADGTVMSVEGLGVLVHTMTDPGGKTDDTWTWKRSSTDPGVTLWALSDTVPCGLGAYFFNASDIGPTVG